MTTLQTLTLIAAGGGAGFVNAVAGGGTILTFPALLLLGVNSIIANATSTVALIIGMLGSLYGYRRQIPAVKPWLKDFIPCSIAGGLIGSVLLTLTPSRIFDCFVPFLLLFATVLFMSQRWIGKHFTGDNSDTRPTWKAVAFQFLIAIYGGYFGAGIGILMLATLGLVGLRDITHMNTVKTVVASVINVIAALYFIWMGLIDWPKMALIATGAMPGYYLGSVFSLKISPVNVRRTISLIGMGIAAYLFFKTFIR